MNSSNVMLSRRSMGLLVALLLISSCTESSHSSSKVAGTVTRSGQATTDSAFLAQGQMLYSKNCATCHGGMAQGAPNWHKRGADGKFPAPPLNGTGHTWHHPKSDLVATIKYGTLVGGGNMPAWKDKLSDAEIEAILSWLQSQWPREIYAQWQKMDRDLRIKQGN